MTLRGVCLQAQAERAAWDMAKEAGLDLVTINPSLVLGPVLTSRADATSIILMKVRENASREFVMNSTLHCYSKPTMAHSLDLICMQQCTDKDVASWCQLFQGV